MTLQTHYAGTQLEVEFPDTTGERHASLGEKVRLPLGTPWLLESPGRPSIGI